MIPRGVRHQQLVLTITIVCSTLSSSLPDRSWYYTTGDWKSGGFPKFPVSSSNCGQRSVSHQPVRGSSGGASAKIVGGSSTPYGAYPWQVEIQAYNTQKRGFDHHCGGAVVGERLVLTAAHCITNLDRPESMRLVVGKHDLRGKDKHERVYRPERIVIHPEFRRDGPHSNDIALIKVKATSETGIDFNKFVQPICLPESDIGPSEGEWCTVTGWGAQKPGDSKSLSSTLRAASVPLLPLSTCRQADVYGGRLQSILDSMLCAGLLEGGVDACEGDSGGPLACQKQGRFVLAGVVSWGDGCAKKNRPGVYTRVAAFNSWIRSTSERLGLS
ncbi:serine protease 33-like isoform X2 [Cimex lectularius]|nr:serine protease 33-like isoform X2 [Cimex lectularius]XP_014239481.1 serine protease 33-like isoform X2 [Cimex lectularius]XP_014239483.1 serine protease 33-like isoform X2 [Cimex lectularius]XP_014239484.1 serine protease 33-like isoform X2 [Cimex lectularius]XP_014239485.1 serine protease 33-like isoform X2 [Cimex lectularius]